MRFWRNLVILSLVMYVVTNSDVFFVRAEDESGAVSEEINALNEEIAEREAHIDQINRRIDEYKDKIEAKQTEAASLQTEVELLDNRVAKTGLEIEATEEMIAAANDELRVIERQISDVEIRLSREKEMIRAILLEMEVQDQTSLIEILLGNDSFSELFDQIQYLDVVNMDLQQTLESAKTHKAALTALRTQKEGKLASLEDLNRQLEQKLVQISQEKDSKEVLISQTQASEAQFSALLYELRQEEEFISNQIAALQGDIEARLNETDALGDSSILSWPFVPPRGISATFHDPTYPYRHLFEHSGLDLPTDVGTPVGSAAPGYVAWTREGRLYGYYVMVIHTDGIATLYAHLSKILVEPDQFVARGDAVGLSGGRAGAPGAGLSTGPHLHFEVRRDGIPVNPLNYLIGE